MTAPSAALNAVACRTCSRASVRPTLIPSTLSGFPLRLVLPSCTRPSPTLNFTPAKVCLPAGSAARLLPAYRPLLKSSLSFWLAWALRSMNPGAASFPLGRGAAGAEAARRRQAARASGRDTGTPSFHEGDGGRLRRQRRNLPPGGAARKDLLQGPRPRPRPGGLRGCVKIVSRGPASLSSPPARGRSPLAQDQVERPAAPDVRPRPAQVRQELGVGAAGLLQGVGQDRQARGSSSPEGRARSS